MQKKITTLVTNLRFLDQREKLKSETSKMYHAPAKEGSDKQLVDILKDIKTLLEEIKNK